MAVAYFIRDCSGIAPCGWTRSPRSAPTTGQPLAPARGVLRSVMSVRPPSPVRCPYIPAVANGREVRLGGQDRGEPGGSAPHLSPPGRGRRTTRSGEGG